MYVQLTFTCGGCGDSGNVILSELTCDLVTAPVVCIDFYYYKGWGETASPQSSPLRCWCVTVASNQELKINIVLNLVFDQLPSALDKLLNFSFYTTGSVTALNYLWVWLGLVYFRLPGNHRFYETEGNVSAFSSGQDASLALERGTATFHLWQTKLQSSVNSFDSDMNEVKKETG